MLEIFVVKVIGFALIAAGVHYTMRFIRSSKRKK